MTRVPEHDLDEGTVDALLRGSVAPHEAPPGWERVAALLRAAGRVGPGEPPPPAFLHQLVAATGAAPSRSRRARGAVLAGGLAAGLVLAGTGVAAANGSLPDPVQGFVHDVAGFVGVDVPAGHESIPGPPTTGGAQDGAGHGRSDDAPGRPVVPGEHVGDPSRADEAPGRPVDPGQSSDAPGQDVQTPTGSADAPGHDVAPPVGGPAAPAGRPELVPSSSAEPPAPQGQPTPSTERGASSRTVPEGGRGADESG